VNTHRLEIIRKIASWKGLLITAVESEIKFSRSTRWGIWCGMLWWGVRLRDL